VPLSPRKYGSEPDTNDLLSEFGSDYPRAETEDIEIIIFDALAG
jgi:hypothetical protein